MMHSFTLWFTPLWSSVYGLAALSAWSIFKVVLGASKQTLLLYNTGLPSWAAAASWRYSGSAARLMLVYIPLISFIVFAALVGTVGDALFAATWLSLPVLFCMSAALQGHCFARAWSASVIAHIVGTFIALICQPVVAWSVLAPMVPCERLVAAAGMVIVSLALDAVARCAARMQVRWTS